MVVGGLCGADGGWHRVKGATDSSAGRGLIGT